MSALDDIALRLPPLPRRLLVGFSGGADSTVLLMLALRLKAAGRLDAVEAVHVNHGLRGGESDADEHFAADVCAAHGVRLYRLRASVTGGEEAARTARYRLFREAMAASGMDALALAHHREDQAETLLLHLMRGSGLRGLCGMRPDTRLDGMRVVRPLLGFSRAEMRRALEEEHIPWREDGSNGDRRYLRNRVRLDVLPAMEDALPGAAARIASAAELLAEDGELLDGLAAEHLPRPPEKRWLSRAELAALPEALRARVLRLWWEAVRGRALDERSLSRAQTGLLTALADAPAGSVCTLPDGWHGRAGRRFVHLVPPEDEQPAPEVPAVDGATVNGITFRVAGTAGEPGDGALEQELPREMLDGAVLRTWRPGDRIRPFGATGSRNLQDYWTDRGIDAPFRRRIPLLCRGSEVLLACGVGAGRVPAYDKTKDNVRIRWQGDIPWSTLEGEQHGADESIV